MQYCIYLNLQYSKRKQIHAIKSGYQFPFKYELDKKVQKLSNMRVEVGNVEIKNKMYFLHHIYYLMLLKHGGFSKSRVKYLYTNVILICYIPVFPTRYNYLQNKISELFTGCITDFCLFQSLSINVVSYILI